MSYKLIHGDCLEVLPTLDAGSVVVISDFPYGIDYKYGVYKDTRENLKKIISSSVPMLREISNRVVIIPGQTQISLYPGFDWIGSITWNTTGQFGHLGFTQFMPYLFYGEDIKGFGSINGVLKSDSIRISGGDGVGFRRTETIKHPCPKPLNIMNYLIKRFSNKGDTILDPFMGSGSTGVSAIKNERNFIGIELDKNYCDEAEQRIKNAAGDYVATDKEKGSPQPSLFW